MAKDLLRRWRFAVALACLAVIARCGAPKPPAAEVEGVAQLLSEASGGEVESTDFVWEPSGGALQDAFLGRRVVFLAARDGTRDVYRARVRVSREGRPLGVAGVYNLSATPLGDEHSLAASGDHVAFVTDALGGAQGVTVLDLRGHQPEGTLEERTLTAIDNVLQVGSTRGLARIDVAFERPPERALIELRDGQLILALGEPPKAAALDLESAVLNTGGDDTYQASAWAIPVRRKPIAHFGMDALRELLGTERADRIKAFLFDLRSDVKGMLGKATAADDEPAEGVQVVADLADLRWPPASIQPRFKHALDGEGQWDAPVDWLPSPPGVLAKPDPYLMETVLRPDTELPFAEVRLMAMDMRQLELRIEAGFDEPRPTVGARGRGRIPKEDRARVVAAFNGAFQTRHGSYGMVVNRRILLLPVHGAATVATDDIGRTFVGSWPWHDQLPPTLVSLRQNLDPLIADGKVNPRDRKQWGFPLDEGTFLTERSALCVTDSGQLIYGWGIELSAQTLAQAMKAARCRYAMHLDMNPGHVGFTFIEPESGRAELMTRDMSIAPNRFLKASAKDFFYLVLRDPVPKLAGDHAWVAEEIEQPPPSWWPAVFRTTVARAGIDVTVRAFDSSRYFWQIRPGQREKAGRTAHGPLDEAEHARAMVAIGLGVGFRSDNRRGLVLDGVVTLPIRPDLGVLITPRALPTLGPYPEIDPTVWALPHPLEIALSTNDMAPAGDATELVLLAEAGEMRAEVRTLGAFRRRSAGCMLKDGTLLVATARAESDKPIAEALLACNCRRILGFNRGTQVDAFVHVAGSQNPPRANYGNTVLYGMAIPARGTAQGFADDTAMPPPIPVPSE